MPEQLGVTISVMSGPDGALGVLFVPLWNGDRQVGRGVLTDMQRALGVSHSVQISQTTYPDELALLDAMVEQADGYHWALQTRSLPELTPAVISAVVRSVARKASSYAMVNWHHLRGAAARVAPDATTFGQRQPHFMTEIIAGLKPKENSSAVAHRWTHELSRQLAPFSLPGGYANLLGPSDHDQAKYAYGANSNRLCDIKRRVDPDAVFTSAIPLPPA